MIREPSMPGVAIREDAVPSAGMLRPHLYRLKGRSNLGPRTRQQQRRVLPARRGSQRPSHHQVRKTSNRLLPLRQPDRINSRPAPRVDRAEKVPNGLVCGSKRENYACTGYGFLCRADSRQRVKHHNGLIGARHDRLGDGEQFVLLAEDPQSWGVNLSAVQLCRCPWRQFCSARLHLRE